MCWCMPSMLLVITLFLSSCRSDQQAKFAKEASEFPMDFEEFYHRFHRDSIFQLGHIVFPLEGKRIDSTGDTTWEKATWIVHKPFNDMGTFNRQITILNGIVIEKIIDESGQYDMERRWSMLGDEWYLIYYKEIGQK